jgi:hypothetical protein
MTTRRSISKKKKLEFKQLEFTFSSDDEKPPTQQRPTRQAYRVFNGTKEQERVMLLTALCKELNTKTSKFIKSTLPQHQRNRILRNIQDEETDFDKLSAQASRAFSITWIKQTAPGKLQYKPQVLAKYASTKKKTKTAPKPPAPLSGRKQRTTSREEPSDSDSDDSSKNLLKSSEDEIAEDEIADSDDAQKDTADNDDADHAKTPTRSNIKASTRSSDIKTPTRKDNAQEHKRKGTLKQPPALTQPATESPPDSPETTSTEGKRNLDDDNSIEDKPNTDEHKDKTIYQEDSSFSYASITREIENANQVFNDTTVAIWKQDLEDKINTKIKTSIATAKDEILEMISTTKGELLTHVDTLRADMKEHETTLEHRTEKAEKVSQQLYIQQGEMERLSHEIAQQQTTLQELMHVLQRTTNKERTETQNTREEARKGFKSDIEQASRHYLVQHEKKSEEIMSNTRNKQTDTFRQSCRETQKEYKNRITQRYDALETESMQFADQAILDLGELLHQEKNNILNEVTYELPEILTKNIKQEIDTELAKTIDQEINKKLKSTTARHTEAITTQHKMITVELSQTAKQYKEQMDTQQTNLQAMMHRTMTTGIDQIIKERMDAQQSQIHTTLQQGMEKLHEKQLTETTEAIDTIKAEASTTFSLELHIQVQQRLNEFDTLLQAKIPIPDTTPVLERQNYIPPTSKYWPETTNQPASPARPSPETPAMPTIDRFKLARSKDLESKLPHFRKDQMHIHLPNEPLQHYMEAFYETLATMMHNYDFPIVLLQDLAPRGSTCPTTAYKTYEQDTILKISRALYQKLLGVIPHTCAIMHNLLANHAATQDGYKALYAMMRLKCTYLQDLLPTWGPAWKTENTAFEYVSNIHSYLTQERRRNKYYSQFEVAAEMVQQAKNHPEYQLLAGAYLAQIIAMPIDQNEMPPEFHTDNLALNFESNKQVSTIPSNPTLNKFGQPRNENSNDKDNGGRRRPQYKNPVQCTSCKLFGHCIETQVCRFSAQLMFAKEYIGAHGNRAKSNAEAYNAANNRNKVNKIYQQFPEKFDEHMTEEERETARYELATTFYCKSTDDQDDQDS